MEYSCSYTAPGQVLLKSEVMAGPLRIVISGYRGPELPATLVEARLQALGPGEEGRQRYCLHSAGRRHEFQALAVAEQAFLPALFDELHQPFQLRRRDRWALRVLLFLLRLPGGGGLLRLWHGRRGSRSHTA